jgi:acyl carrier protein
MRSRRGRRGEIRHIETGRVGREISDNCVCLGRLGSNWEIALDLQKEVREILRDVLSLGARADRFERNTALLGAVPELDSMAVVGVIAALEDRFGFTVDDDEISGATFATFGSLIDFVASKTA